MANDNNILAREWTTLGQVRDYIQQHTQEKVVSFNGFELVTDQYAYGLAHGKLRRSNI